MNNPNTKISCGIVLLLSLTIVSCGGGNSGGGGGNGGGSNGNGLGNGGGNTPLPITDRDLELIEPETLGTFSASADNGGVIRYSNKEDAPSNNNVIPGIHHAIEIDNNQPYPSEIIFGDNFAFNSAIFSESDSQTRNENLVIFRRGNFNNGDGTEIYRVHSYDVKASNDGNFGVSAEFIAIEPMPSMTSWENVSNYAVHISGAVNGTLPTGIYEYEGLTVATSRINGSWFGEQPFQMIVNFTNGTGAINKKPNSSGTFLTPGRTIYNEGEIILNGELTIDMSDGTFTGTNLSFRSVESINGTQTVHYDSSINNYESVSLYGSFHGQTGDGVSGVFHNNADSPTLIGAIIGRNAGTFSYTPLQTGVIHRLSGADGGQVFYYENKNSRNHYVLSIGDTHYPSVPIQGAQFDATSGSATYGEYGDANRTYLATGIFNKNFGKVYGFAGYSVRGHGNALDSNGNTIPVLDDRWHDLS